ncbi:MAG: PilZ domain-containing protein [Myxococcota bacterium]|nr:PilZ domain-containing protein [Myxococcota bacterium]
MQRQHPRAFAWFYLNHYIDGAPFLARAYNLSPGGLAIDGLSCPQNGHAQRVFVEFELPNCTELIFSDVDVVWRNPTGGFGLKFTSLAPRFARKIREYLKSRQVRRENILMEPDSTCNAYDQFIPNPSQVNL